MRLNRLLYALLLVITMQSFSLAQEREVSGSVKDASGEPLFGAAVMVEGGVRVPEPIWMVNLPLR